MTTGTVESSVQQHHSDNVAARASSGDGESDANLQSMGAAEDAAGGV